MANPFLGRNGYVAIAAESTYGTAVTVTNFRSPISAVGSRNLNYEVTPQLRSGSSTATVDLADFQASETPSGSFELPMSYENMGMWLKGSMGLLATSGAGPYTHTFTLKDLSLANGCAWTLEMIRGNATNSEKFTGVKFAKTRWRWSAGGLLTQAVDWIGRSGSARGSPTSVSNGSGDTWITANHLGQMTWNSRTYDLIDGEISIDHSLVRRQLCGSIYTQEPVAGKSIAAMARFTVEYSEDNPYSGQVAGTQSDADFTFTSGSQSLRCDAHNLRLMKVSEPVNNQGIIRQTWEAKLFADTGGDLGLKWTLINANSSGTAN